MKAPENPSIYLVEDDIGIGAALKNFLELEEYRVTWAQDIETATHLNTSDFTLMLLDINLPDGNGLDFCRRLREKGLSQPIIFLTARDDEASLIKGFENGANDYIKKPFSNRELLVRIQALLRKTLLNPRVLEYAGLRLDIDARELLKNGERIPVPGKSFDILCYFFKSFDRVITRENLIAALNSEEIYDRTIDSHISKLRKFLNQVQVTEFQIKSVYRVGYQIEKINETHS